MYSSFSYVIPTSISSTKKLLRLWGGNNVVVKFPWRRLVSRMPLLILWCLMVIFVLYKLTCDSAQRETPSSVANKNPTSQLQALRRFKDYNEVETIMKLHENIPPINSDNNKQATVITSKPNLSILSTTKKSTTEYSRQTKVFILLIQNERQVNNKPIKRFAPSSTTTTNRASTEKSYNFLVPAHIRVLAGILDAHRISYDIDTTKTGLPTALLNDHSSASDRQAYSVIIIDNFAKYTKLNRWIRDQLDRHCRLNNIGVISYLVPEQLEPVNYFDFEVLKNTARPSRNFKSLLLKHDHSIHSTTTTTDESLADQFPISFKTLDKHSNCQALNYSCLIDYQLNEKSPILRTLKRRPNFIIEGPLQPNLNRAPWISMSSNHITYEPLTWAKVFTPSSQKVNDPMRVTQSILREKLGLNNRGQQSASDEMTGIANDTTTPSADYTSFNDDPERRVLSMLDRGLFDGIKRVIFGGANHFWLNRALLLDAIEHLSTGKIFSPLERFIQIDIDDIFVGEKGIRLKRNDVYNLIEAQKNFTHLIDGGFKFNLGFSGKYYKHGMDSENEGDEELLANSKEFTWFCHTWAHTKAHLFNNTESIKDELRKNLVFAREHKLVMIGHDESETNSAADDAIMPATYAVAPHHSGVYPVHNELYEAWRQVLGVQVTSTEEYPSLRPAEGRRAFVYKTIKVLPRQTCGLYTHTIYKRKYPGGFEKLLASIDGGELFETILHNPVNIYMTHMSNYANDRLALFTFQRLFEFVRLNTNLVLQYVPSGLINGSLQLGPSKLADYYFKLYPDEKDPLWTNPCLDKRHLSIWSQYKIDLYCPVAPSLLIVGPQKTGTTALYTFLKLNPLFKSSLKSAADFEEVQFFNDKYYLKNGLDWYFSRFVDGVVDGGNLVSANDTSSKHIYFDKSATYFDDPKVPLRANKLLPNARIIIILINPADRAYSWYQHVKAHGDPLANSESFEEIIMSPDEPKFKSLRSRCLHPGYYAQHLSNWLQHYQSKQIIIIDGQWFKHNPASVMNRLQLLLHLNDEREVLDYNKLLRFDQEKGFFCVRDEPCLGASKGRKYKPMSDEARFYLNSHYYAHNRQLARILSEIGQPLPIWLEEVLSIQVRKDLY